MPALPHAFDILLDQHTDVKATHKVLQSQGVVTRGQHKHADESDKASYENISSLFERSRMVIICKS